MGNEVKKIHQNKNIRFCDIAEKAGETNELQGKLRNVVTSKLQLDGNQVISDFCSGSFHSIESNHLSPVRFAKLFGC